MFGKFFQKPSPLFDRLESSTPDKLGQLVEDRKDTPNALELTISMMTMCGAGEFLRVAYPGIRKSLLGASKEIVAFEALIFFSMALRIAYVQAHGEQVEDPIEDELIDLPEYLDDAFRFARGVTMSLATHHSNWPGAEEVFKKRLMEYVSADGLVGRNGAGEQFRFILQSIGKAASPAVTYGPVNLDLMQGLEAIASVHAFTASIPAGYAETLHRIITTYGFDR